MVFRFNFVLAAVIALGIWNAETAHAVIRIVGSESATIGWDQAPGQVAGYDVFTSVNQHSETLQGQVGIDEPFVLNASFGDSVVVRVRPFNADGEYGPLSDPSDEISFSPDDDDPADGFGTTAMDFNGDSRADILIQNTRSNELEIWMMDGETVESSVTMPDQLDDSWRVVEGGDFNGDGMADVVWRQDTGDIIIWLNDNGQVIDSVQYGGIPTYWEIVGTGDFNGDGKDDLIFAHRQGAVAAVWLMDGIAIARSGRLNQGDDAMFLPDSHTLEATPDLNADGNADLLWRQADGKLVAWMINENEVIDTTNITSPTHAWSLVGTPDLDGDDADELLWRHETGTLYVWFMDGTTISDHSRLEDPGLEWHIVGIRDFDGDGRDDMLWQHDVGLLYTFLMDGETIRDHGMVGSPGAEFEVIE